MVTFLYLGREGLNQERARARQIWKGALRSAGRRENAHSSLNNVSSNEGLHKSNSVLGNCNVALW